MTEVYGMKQIAIKPDDERREMVEEAIKEADRELFLDTMKDMLFLGIIFGLASVGGFWLLWQIGALSFSNFIIMNIIFISVIVAGLFSIAWRRLHVISDKKEAIDEMKTLVERIKEYGYKCDIQWISNKNKNIFYIAIYKKDGSKLDSLSYEDHDLFDNAGFLFLSKVDNRMFNPNGWVFFRKCYFKNKVGDEK